MPKRFNLTIVILSMFFFSCFSSSSKNPDEVYKYWLGVKAPKSIELLNGQYYQSPHFTLEYEVFLELKSDKKWRRDFISINKLQIDTLNNYFKHSSFPEWFKPTNDYLVYGRNKEFDRSKYFINRQNGMCYIYETVGM